MKTSLNSKILILSMSALVAFVGCERRGRAPVKGAASVGGGVLNPTSPLPLSQPSGTPSSTPSKPVADDEAAQDAKLLADAQMTDCKVPMVAKGDVSAASFLADAKLIKDFRDTCLAPAGLILVCKDKAGIECSKDTQNIDRVWAVDTSESSKAKEQFNLLVKASDADKALQVMDARVSLAVSRLGKLGAKYSDEALKKGGLDRKGSVKDPNSQADISIDGMLTDVANGAQGIENSRKDIAAFRPDLDNND